MNLDLKKKLDLNKKMVLDLAKTKGIDGTVARVVLCLDFSASMDYLYKSGKVQELLERIVPVAMAFDDNGEMELFIFHNNAFLHPNNVTENNVENLVNREIMTRYQWGGTKYAPSIQMILNETKNNSKEHSTGGGLFRKAKRTYSSDIPTYVIFITDGDNNDKGDAVEAITEASKAPIFFQFVGIGKANFNFLERLDNLPGRYVDNANFFQANDISKMSNNELYDNLLSEFPDWIKQAKSLNLLTS